MQLLFLFVSVQLYACFFKHSNKGLLNVLFNESPLKNTERLFLLVYKVNRTMREEAHQLACYLQKPKFFQQFQGVSEGSTHM